MSYSLQTLPAARSVAAGRGLEWWLEAWRLFVRNVPMWVALALVLIVAFLVIGIVPLLGGLAVALVVPVFAGSWMLAARKVEGGGELDFGDLFTCFRGAALKPLLVLGACLLAGTVVIALVATLLGVGAIVGGAAGSGHAGGMMAMMGGSLLAVLVAMSLGLLAAMASWFAPALVVFRGLSPVDAIKASFAACLRNVVPFLVYGVFYVLASVVASIPMGLGWIVLTPVLLLTVYVSYRDVFGA